MLAFFVLVGVLLAVALTLRAPAAPWFMARQPQMRLYAEQTGGDFPDDEIPQDFPFSLTDDLNWGYGRHCIFWRSGGHYILVLDAEIGFGRQARPLTLVAARKQASSGIIWSIPREIEMRAEDGWVVLLKRRRRYFSGMLSTQEIEQLRQIVLTSPA